MGERILIVEDDETLREIYCVKFELEGFRVRAAGDGLEGLKEAAEEEPDLILLDMLMPKLGGLEFLRRFRTKYASSHAKILVASNKSSSDTIAKAMALGANDYLIKSHLTPDQIVAHVRRHLIQSQ